MIVYSYYVLDIIHEGHLLMMKNAKALAGKEGKSIVGILTDEATMEKKPKPVISFEQRVRLAEAIKYVDMVVAQDSYSPLDNVERIQPDIFLESSSHTKENIQHAKNVVRQWGGKVMIIPYYPNQSSSKIKEEVRGDGD